MMSDVISKKAHVIICAASNVPKIYCVFIIDLLSCFHLCSHVGFKIFIYFHDRFNTYFLALYVLRVKIYIF